MSATSPVQGLLAAYNARDMDALLALFHPAAEWHTTPEFLWPGPYRGRIALRQKWKRLGKAGARRSREKRQ